MHKLFRYFKLFILVCILIPVLICNINVYHPQYASFQEHKKIIKKQLNYLDWTINHDGPAQMQRLYPEGAFFMYALYSLSYIQYARRFEQFNEESKTALEKAKFGIIKMEDEFSRFSYLKNLNPPYGIYMSGWLNWAKGSYNLVARKLGTQESFETEFKNASQAIAQAFEQSKTHYLKSYQYGSWPSDNIVAIASLKLHDELYEQKYALLIQDWLTKVKQTQDKHTEMFPYQSHHETGLPIEGVHANAQAVIIRFLAELDKEYTIEQYKLFSGPFDRRLFGLRFTREVPKDSGGKRNIDSGPIIFEVGTAASIVAQIPYRIFQDQAHIEQLIGSINAMGFPITWGQKTRYIFGLMPVADAFLVWGTLAKPYTQTYDPIILHKSNNMWRLWFHFYSLVCALLTVFIFYPKKVLNIYSKKTN